MKVKKYVVSLVIITIGILFTVIYFKSPIRSSDYYPLLSGTFIQIDMAQNWNKDKWISEFTYLKRNKMNYVVLTGISLTDKSGTKTVYKSNIPGTQKIYGDRDELDLCLSAAEKLGIKVFLGMDFNDEWWQQSPDNENWLKDQMNRANLICDEIYEKYHSKYKNAFYGWYFPYEVDNARFNNKVQFDNLAKGINLNLDYLESKKERLPFLMSPFMNSEFGTAKEYAQNWKYFFSKVNFKEGDIFCPQDSVGAGGLDVNEINPWLTALRKAVNTKKGLKFWSNIETFDYVNNSSITLDKLVKRMEIESPCVDKMISFSYSHYYSPNNINSGFNDAYYTYVNTGNLEKKQVDSPTNLKVQKLGEYEFKISWNKPDNYSNICAYRVYRNGVLIYSPTIQRIYGGNSKEFYFSVVDRPMPKENTKSYTYEVKAVDFSGNMSESSEKVTVNVKPLKILPNVLSKGCKYNLSPNPDLNYGDDGVKLTDGKYASTKKIEDSQFAAWYGNSFNLEVDLKRVEEVSQFMIDYYRNPRRWVYLPKAASVAVSEDGVNFKAVGLIMVPSVPFSDRGSSRYPLYLTLDKAVNARYIKLTTVVRPSCYTFIDEFQVRN
ncbi:DUF4434 domain-containing protein [Clostridium sp.]|jgi:hypothetical protein|uniref:DUF4434 domain-containing protein n=1 Tax=Clostridium sp. TaxID=1506 RepID=UPI003A5C26EC